MDQVAFDGLMASTALPLYRDDREEDQPSTTYSQGQSTMIDDSVVMPTELRMTVGGVQCLVVRAPISYAIAPVDYPVESARVMACIIGHAFAGGGGRDLQPLPTSALTTVGLLEGVDADPRKKYTEILFADLLPSHFRKPLLSRLAIILDPDELQDRRIIPLESSFTSLLAFLKQHPKIAAPQLTITPRGYFKATWRKARDSFVTLEFRGRNDVHWLVFAPNSERPDGIEPGAGESDFRQVMKRLKNYKADQWMRRA